MIRMRLGQQELDQNRRQDKNAMAMSYAYLLCVSVSTYPWRDVLNS